MQSDIPVVFAFAALALALEVASWMTASQLLQRMQATERLNAERRKIQDFRDRITHKKIERLTCAKLSCQTYPLDE